MPAQENSTVVPAKNANVSQSIPAQVAIQIQQVPVENQIETPTEQQVDVEALIPKDSYQTDPLFYQVADYFNVDSEEYPIAKDYLSEIVDFAIRETKSNDPAEILKKIREVEDKVQPPQWGEKRYWNIRKYIRLANQKSSIEKAMGAFIKKET